ncbi:MAG: site-2 protease family protein [Pseudomonadota bacterium]|jgi:Zn-dependent protease/CBS domain-containing protein
MVQDTLRSRTVVDERRRGWSIQVGSIGAIPIRIHLTFLMLLGWLLLGGSSESAVSETAFVLLVFVCVLLHELSHALVAKRFDVKTRDITLYPFGGIASIVSQPSPKAELVIALAGPALNLAIAAALYPWLTMPDLTEAGLKVTQESDLGLGIKLFFTNLALAAFNLLPALPMDGGRVLRASLALLNVREPTAIAARVSQALCVLLAIAGLYLEQPMLFIIAVLVFLGAMQEHLRAETKAIATTFSIQEAMIAKERLESFPHGTTISRALSTTLTSWQPLYPVMNGDALLGIVLRDDILEHAVTHADDYVGEIMKRDINQVDIGAPLAEAYAQMESTAAPVLAVTSEGRYVGILAYDRLADFLLMHELRNKMPKDEDIEWPNP